jgi:hypothetical protein
LHLISYKCYLNGSNFYFVIGLTGIHIERYLGGEAEFKTAINRITVDFGSFSHSSTTTTSPSLLQFDPNRTQAPGREPLPSCEGCGLNEQTIATTVTASNDEPPAYRAPPLC